MQEVGGHRPTCRRSSFRLVDERPSVVERASTVGTAAGHGWPAVREAAIVGLGLAVGVTAWFRDAGQKPAPPPPDPETFGRRLRQRGAPCAYAHTQETLDLAAA